VELRDGIRRGIGVITRVPGMNSPLARQVKTLRLGCAHHLDPICRTAVYVIRMYGGEGGGWP